MIEIQGLYKSFKKSKALHDIHAEFYKGQVVSLIGPNGSGKTTLIKCILGLVKPDKGNILLESQSVLTNDQYRSRIGYMPQIGRFPDHMKVGQIFKLLKEIRRDSKLANDDELIDAFNLKSIENKSMRTLSGGTRQKVSAAIAFLFDPEVLILDEPTAGLDPLSSEILKEKIQKEKNRNKLLLITSHILSDLDDLTSHVLYLQEGNILFNGDIGSLRKMTGEEKFGKAIASFMKTKNM